MGGALIATSLGVKMKMRLIIIVISITILYGCVGSKQGIIEASKEETIHGIRDVASNIRMNYEQGNLDVKLIAGENIITDKNVDLVLSKTATNLFNNTSTFGKIKLTLLSLNETNYDAVFTSAAGDPWAKANMIYEMTKQQINISRGAQEPFINPMKPTKNYILLTAISPILSAKYLLDDNPLVSKSNHKWVYLQNGLGDITMLGLFVAGIFAEKDQHMYFWSGISISIIWKLFSLFNITDINDYNVIARSPYNLSKIITE